MNVSGLRRAAVVLLGVVIGVWWPSTAAAQGTQTTQVMRQKLAESQQLLAALVTSNWVTLDRRGRALEELTKAPGWEVILLPEFTKFTGAFQRANEALIAAAQKRDQLTALVAYNGLVTSCIDCHRYVARARLASLDPRERARQRTRDVGPVTAP